MCAGSDNLQSLLAYKAGENATKICDIGAGFFYILADPSAHFDHRLDHFRFDLLAEQRLAFSENFGDMRPQLTGVRIDNLKLFFNTERELLRHTGVGFLLSDSTRAEQVALEVDEEQHCG